VRKSDNKQRKTDKETETEISKRNTCTDPCRVGLVITTVLSLGGRVFNERISIPNTWQIAQSVQHCYGSIFLSNTRQCPKLVLKHIPAKYTTNYDLFNTGTKAYFRKIGSTVRRKRIHTNTHTQINRYRIFLPIRRYFLRRRHPQRLINRVRLLHVQNL
jgi:hypothetical protein